MNLPEDARRDLARRLHRVAGQVHGITRMIDEERECRDVVTQFAAARKALERAAYKYFSSTLTECFARPDEAAGEGYTPEELERLFLRL